MQISLQKSDFDLLNRYLEDEHQFFQANWKNDHEVLLFFKDEECALVFDEFIKDQLLYRGFNADYEPNQYGRMCERIVDKMFAILK
ncbi:MAG: hypothetical protein CMP59_08205 [Flavobacteriales bacterium]|nr:hypothetical protein [Flavobacteriales bacterium]|tara:strand:- start:856 stop:1113 length:258 start_codon:yes stop_codon:yes gene_type:complete